MQIGYNRSADPIKYGAVILAAGLSSRMKEFKPLLHVDGRTAISGLVEAVRASGIEDILVVTGHRREDIRHEIDSLRVDEAVNDNYEEGMFTSIKTGLAKATSLWPDKEGYFLIPVDCPLISVETMRELMEAHTEREREQEGEGKEFFVPVYEGKKGHPLLVPAGRCEEIISYDGQDGLKGVTDRDQDAMVRVSVNDEGCLLDMDTPEDYDDIRKYVEKGFRREKLSVLSGRKRVVFVRHGETMQHEGPMFIGQYDVSLSDRGREQAIDAAEEIIRMIEPDVAASEGWIEGISVGKEPLPPLEGIYCSDLSRSTESAEIIVKRIREHFGSRLPNITVTPMKDLREISLGDWDGKPIEEIKNEFPEDYERRGRDIFTFKKGNRAENFYDMQYRAVKALREILASDDGKNMIIVAHSGVIRALENNLKGYRVDDEWDPVEKGCVRIWESPPVP